MQSFCQLIIPHIFFSRSSIRDVATNFKWRQTQWKIHFTSTRTSTSIHIFIFYSFIYCAAWAWTFLVGIRPTSTFHLSECASTRYVLSTKYKYVQTDEMPSERTRKSDKLLFYFMTVIILLYKYDSILLFGGAGERRAVRSCVVPSKSIYAFQVQSGNCVSSVDGEWTECEIRHTLRCCRLLIFHFRAVKHKRQRRRALCRMTQPSKWKIKFAFVINLARIA